MLVLDVGTTSAKVVLYADDTALFSAERRLTLYTSNDGGAEQDPHEVYASLKQAMIGVLRHARREGRRIQGVGFSAAMHSLIPVSWRNEPLGRAWTWLDRRASDVEDAIKATERGNALYTQTGTPIHAMSPVVKLLWMRREMPERFDAAAKFVSLKEWIWFAWFGTWEIDAAMASATGLYDIGRGQWCESALSLTGIRAEQLSILRPTSFVRWGCQDEDLVREGLSSDVGFNIGATDGTLANLGAGAMDSAVATLTVGTSLAVRVSTRERFTNPKAMSFCYVLDDEYFICGQPSNSGGAVLEWVWELFDDGTLSLPRVLDEASRVEIQDLYCLPYLFGERAPLWSSKARAAWIGLQKHHGRAHMMRAALEGVLLNAFWAAATLFEGRNWPDAFLISGKIFENPRMTQLLADVLGAPVSLQLRTDTSVRGALVLARRALGLTDMLTVPQRAEGPSDERDITFLPTNHARYVQKFEVFRDLVASGCFGRA